MAGGLLARAQIGLPLDEPHRAATKYVALTADEVKAAFARKIRPEDFVQVVRGPAPSRARSSVRGAGGYDAKVA